MNENNDINVPTYSTYVQSFNFRYAVLPEISFDDIWWRPLANAYKFIVRGVSFTPYCIYMHYTYCLKMSVPIYISLPAYSTYMQNFGFRSVVFPEISVVVLGLGPWP